MCFIVGFNFMVFIVKYVKFWKNVIFNVMYMGIYVIFKLVFYRIVNFFKRFI